MANTIGVGIIGGTQTGAGPCGPVPRARGASPVQDPGRQYEPTGIGARGGDKTEHSAGVRRSCRTGGPSCGRAGGHDRKVPYHHELVLAALAAGKSVYCRWPLGIGLHEGGGNGDPWPAARRFPP